MDKFFTQFPFVFTPKTEPPRLTYNVYGQTLRIAGLVAGISILPESCVKMQSGNIDGAGIYLNLIETWAL